MLSSSNLANIAKALQLNNFNSDPFEFNGSVNEYLLEVLESLEIKDDKISYIIDGQEKVVQKGILTFEIYTDHIKLNIGKHLVGRVGYKGKKGKKRTYYAFMYSGTDTKRFIEELLDHIRKVDIIVMITEAPAPTPFSSPASSVPASSSSSSCVVS